MTQPAAHNEIAERIATPILFSVKKFTSRHSAWMTNGWFRDQLFHRKTNGLEASGAIVQLGRKLAIDETHFFQWLRNRDRTSVAPCPGHLPTLIR